jgi:hypothetical protein
MNSSQHGLGAREIIVATSTAFVLAACGTAKNQDQIPSVETPSATHPLQQNARGSSIKPTPAHPRSRYVTSSHPVPSSDKANVATNNENAPGNTAAVLSGIHRANLTKIALGILAENKAWAPEVRGYADQLVQDHTSVDGTILAMARKKGIHLRDGAASSRL